MSSFFQEILTSRKDQIAKNKNNRMETLSEFALERKIEAYVGKVCWSIEIW